VFGDIVKIFFRVQVAVLIRSLLLFSFGVVAIVAIEERVVL
jgi:hypothetical protein